MRVIVFLKLLYYFEGVLMIGDELVGEAKSDNFPHCDNIRSWSTVGTVNIYKIVLLMIKIR